MRVPVMAKPTRKGQLRFHSLLKKTGHGSNFLVFFDSLFYANIFQWLRLVDGDAAEEVCLVIDNALVLIPGFSATSFWAAVKAGRYGASFLMALFYWALGMGVNQRKFSVRKRAGMVKDTGRGRILPSKPVSLPSDPSRVFSCYPWAVEP
ncbi:hypothetical protein D5086_020694 [Populus alba]|uniref:Uncharacterized protein n=1 Tax=Populus alba TaxID=43335 RepID=A0ACC4BLF0_POPAL